MTRIIIGHDATKTVDYGSMPTGLVIVDDEGNAAYLPIDKYENDLFQITLTPRYLEQGNLNGRSCSEQIGLTLTLEFGPGVQISEGIWGGESCNQIEPQPKELS